jgi:uncharacterized protein YrrD
MKRILKDLTNYTIGATDGEIGKVTDFLFDNTSWTIRYLVVETGGWLSGRRVLLSPQALQGIDNDHKVFSVNLTKEQVQHSPDIDTDKPVSRQQEVELYRHYPWTSYWGGDLWAGGIGTAGMMMPVTEPMDQAVRNAMIDEQQSPSEREGGNPHLFSATYVHGYSIQATDGIIGDVKDLVVDDTNWQVNYLLVDTGNWLPGKKVLLTPQQIKDIDWDTSSVVVDATEAQVKNSPAYNLDEPITDDYATRLSSHYTTPVK